MAKVDERKFGEVHLLVFRQIVQIDLLGIASLVQLVDYLLVRQLVQKSPMKITQILHQTYLNSRTRFAPNTMRSESSVMTASAKPLRERKASCASASYGATM